MSTRKKWGFTVNDGEMQRHISERAVYDAALEEAENWVVGRITVWVDEGHGFGWGVYEYLDLAELAESRK